MTLRDRLEGWLPGRPDAVEMILTVHDIYELWDDLIDQDPTTAGQINKAFYAALVTLPRNTFYQQNFALLNPIIEAAILDWLTANEFEKSKQSEKLRHSWGLRFTPFLLTVFAARVIGGMDHAAKVNAEFRALAEPWEKYASEHGVG